MCYLPPPKPIHNPIEYTAHAKWCATYPPTPHIQLNLSSSQFQFEGGFAATPGTEQRDACLRLVLIACELQISSVTKTFTTYLSLAVGLPPAPEALSAVLFRFSVPFFDSAILMKVHVHRQRKTLRNDTAAETAIPLDHVLKGAAIGTMAFLCIGCRPTACAFLDDMPIDCPSPSIGRPSI